MGLDLVPFVASAGGLFLAAFGSAVLIVILLLAGVWLFGRWNFDVVERGTADGDERGTATLKETDNGSDKGNKVETEDEKEDKYERAVVTTATVSTDDRPAAVERSDESASTSLSARPTSTATLPVATSTAAATDKVDKADKVESSVEEAKRTLSHIHAQLPAGLDPAEKYAMTQMMLLAIKVNESVKATASMQRMEQITGEGNEIQSELRTIKESKARREEIARRTLALQTAMMDVLAVGVVAMLCSTGAVLWYGGRRTSIGPFRLRTVRTLAAASCGGQAATLFETLVPPIGQLVCHAAHAVRIVQAALLLVLTPIVISKVGLFQLGSEAPVFRLVTTCGLICGASGSYAVDWLGGRGVVWFLLWEAYVGGTIGVIVSAKRLVARYGKDVDTYNLFGVWILAGVVVGSLPFFHV